ncbi:MAG: hypothetical protein A2667_02665 [Candidatus Wildermuthbacteria bacterium RIFCSPHIGHO2_01_FULL_47_27]|uniref:Inositol-1-monophosphatase n=2 Tax=Candidatus Wildermuthiibacteriota TaxID=1817923 RepID=A0A1G2RP04_9BACT|nr:MAG: Inositol-phosphate phosphatase [Parcubacteria group bacterium GW2011_GWA2_47_9]OHA63630.1 MAG: hypothetical protein A2667_02665 [Candidatus Wildermuthbacteria bacterium RIFCSPHIGHO2_01_FULL_47_27]OHA68308.1 MAG: hypothetical protein A3D59_04070 [Candidatus Wildermuthbacteria bacterium RIFCSPHIGHO2_02_FULL_47_17]OHA73761.1 MAG: hypothetical protein A3A32_01410 [Candidatus Wildermuthbacteria bacterium RIFCSPLOWO2_01_FULL_48_35]
MLYRSVYADALTPVVREAGAIILGHFKDPGRVREKTDKTVVTAVDEMAERHIVQAIKQYFPNHGILAEEGGRISKGKEFCWVVDGLDGTRNYTWNIPIFSVTTALFENGKPVFGIVYAPITGEMFIAEHGSGAWLGDNRMTVSEQTNTGKMHFSFGYGKSSHSRGKSARILSGLSSFIGGYRIYVSMALELAYVAAGRLGGVIATENSPWDCAAGILLVQEAGGIVTDFKGNQYTMDSSGDILASTSVLHPQLLDYIQRHKLYIL